MAAIVPSEFLNALKLKHKPASTSNEHQIEEDFFSRKRLVQNGANSHTIETDRDDESSEKGISDLAVDSDFLALLNSALPLSNIRAMVAEQHRQDQEELTRVKKSLDKALKTYRECREKEPTLQKELNEVNNEIERKRKEIELLREELRDTCNKEEKLRRKRDKLSSKYEGMKKRAKYCKEALSIIPKFYKRQVGEEQAEDEEDDGIQDDISDVEDDLPSSPPRGHTPTDDNKMDAQDEGDSRAKEPTPTHPHILPSVTKSPTRKDPTLKMLPLRQSVSEDNTTAVPVVQVLVQKTPVQPAVEVSKSVDQRQPLQKNTFEKIPEVVSMPHVDSDEFEDDDDDELEGGYMGVPIEDDDDSDSDTSGNLVIQMPRSRSREDDNFDNDYVPDTASGGN